MNVAYVRVSTVEQNTDRQMDAFGKRGLVIDKVFSEKRSGKSAFNRPALMEMLEFVKAGDVVYVTELSRLGRNMMDLCKIVEGLKDKGVTFVSLKENIDLSSSTGELMFHLMASFADFERKIILERQAEGIAAAKERGKEWGAKKQHCADDREWQEIAIEFYNGRITGVEAVQRFGGSRTAFYYRYNKWVSANGLEQKNHRLGGNRSTPKDQ